VSVGHKRSPTKADGPIKMRFESGVPKEPCMFYSWGALHTQVDVRSVSPVLTSGTHFLSISGNEHQ